MFRFFRMARRSGNRIRWWPIRFGLSPMRWWNISWHGFELDAEPDPYGRTAHGYVSGLRGVYGHTITLGPFQVRFAPLCYELFTSPPEENLHGN